MYTFLIVLILIASVLMVLAVLVQNPKSGMASNFGASNQVMGVRQTADFLEKFTWGAAVVVLVLSLVFTIFIGGWGIECDCKVNIRLVRIVFSKFWVFGKSSD